MRTQFDIDDPIGLPEQLPCNVRELEECLHHAPACQCAHRSMEEVLLEAGLIGTPYDS